MKFTEKERADILSGKLSASTNIVHEAEVEQAFMDGSNLCQVCKEIEALVDMVRSWISDRSKITDSDLRTIMVHLEVERQRHVNDIVALDSL